MRVLISFTCKVTQSQNRNFIQLWALFICLLVFLSFFCLAKSHFIGSAVWREKDIVKKQKHFRDQTFCLFCAAINVPKLKANFMDVSFVIRKLEHYCFGPLILTFLSVSVLETIDLSVSDFCILFMDHFRSPKCHYWSLFFKMLGPSNSHAEIFEQFFLSYL